jgi:hypothetical protein
MKKTRGSAAAAAAEKKKKSVSTRPLTRQSPATVAEVRSPVPEGYVKKIGSKSLGTPIGKRKQPPAPESLRLPAPKKKAPKKLQMALAVEQFDDYMEDS